MDITQKIQELVETFKALNSWEERYKKLIELGKGLPAMAAEEQIEANKIKGCQSQVWLAAKHEDGKVFLSADSDASIVKGIIALLLKVYSGETPDTILTVRPTFLEEIGLKQHLSMSRANGLNAMVKQINLYALAFKAQAQMQKESRP
ncbi:MAG: SufE family protein [Bdellovibrio sp.]|nr:SufE family protein [Bdellovibrio sp.]